MSHAKPIAIVSSQSAFPGRATWRTVVQNVISVVLTAGVVLPLAVAIAGEELADVLPANWLAWGVGAAASVAAIAAALTRIMAIPAVDAALRRFGLSSTPKAAPVTADGVHVITNLSAVPPEELERALRRQQQLRDLKP